jgi:hypothetical protein
MLEKEGVGPRIVETDAPCRCIVEKVADWVFAVE